MVKAGRAGTAAAGGFLKKMVGNLFRPAGKTMARGAGRTAVKSTGRNVSKTVGKAGGRGSRTFTKTAKNKLGFGCADPIDPVTGDVVYTETDVELLGALPLVLDRTHLSSYRAGGWFGPSWASTLDQRIEIADDGVWFASADGMLLLYPSAAEAEEALPEEGPRWPLNGSRHDGYVITNHQSGHTMHFARTDSSAPSTMPLTAITDRAGHRIDVGRDTSGAPAEIRHSGGYHLGVGTSNGRITALRLPQGARDGSDLTLMRYRYDDDGNLAEVVNESGISMRFGYDEAGRMTGWTDRNGTEYEYVYDEQGRCVRAEGTAGYLSGTFAYDTDNNATTYTDSLRNTTTFQMNDHGQVVRKIDTLGGTTAFEWDLYDNLVVETDPLGRTVRHRYDSYGNPTMLARSDGSHTSVDYDDLGLPVTVVDPDGAVWRQEFDTAGNLTLLTDPTEATQRYGYDARAHLVSATDALGSTSSIECDRAGLPVRVTDPLGATIRYHRDGFGRIGSITDPLGGRTHLEWTVGGRIARVMIGRAHV